MLYIDRGLSVLVHDDVLTRSALGVVIGFVSECENGNCYGHEYGYGHEDDVQIERLTASDSILYPSLASILEAHHDACLDVVVVLSWM